MISVWIVYSTWSSMSRRRLCRDPFLHDKRRDPDLKCTDIRFFYIVQFSSWRRIGRDILLVYKIVQTERDRSVLVLSYIGVWGRGWKTLLPYLHDKRHLTSVLTRSVCQYWTTVVPCYGRYPTDDILRVMRLQSNPQSSYRRAKRWLMYLRDNVDCPVCLIYLASRWGQSRDDSYRNTVYLLVRTRIRIDDRVHDRLTYDRPLNSLTNDFISVSMKIERSMTRQRSELQI